MANEITGVLEAIQAAKSIDEIFADKQKTASILADLIRDRARENYRVIDPDVEMEEFTSHVNSDGAEVDVWEGTLDGEKNPNQAIQIEFGDSSHDARPYLRPAVDEIASDNHELMEGLQTRLETNARH
jgi:hypothetical protein